VESGQLGIFANGYPCHPAMKLPSEVNLQAAVGGVSNPINLDQVVSTASRLDSFVEAAVNELDWAPIRFESKQGSVSPEGPQGTR